MRSLTTLAISLSLLLALLAGTARAQFSLPPCWDGPFCLGGQGGGGGGGGGGDLPINLLPAQSGNYSAAGYSIRNLANPVLSGDAIGQGATGVKLAYPTQSTVRVSIPRTFFGSILQLGTPHAGIVQAGDTEIALISYAGNVSINPPSAGAYGSWTAIPSCTITDAANDITIAVFYHQVTTVANELPTYSFTNGGNSGPWTGVNIDMYDVNSSTIQDICGTATATSSASFTIPSITTSFANETVIAFAAQDASNVANPPSTSNSATSIYGSNYSAGAWYYNQAAAGTTPTFAVSNIASSGWVGLQLAIQNGLPITSPVTINGQPLTTSNFTGTITASNVNGEDNVTSPLFAGGADPTGSLCSDNAFAAAIADACGRCTVGNQTAPPRVFIPKGAYNFCGTNGPAIYNNCGCTLEIYGAGAGNTFLTGPNTAGLVMINSISPNAYTALGALTAANLATGGTANTALNWATNSGGGSYNGEYWYNLSAAMHSTYGPRPFNGKGSMGIRFYLKTPIADSNTHDILTSTSFLTPLNANTLTNANTAFYIKYQNSTLSAGFNTAGYPANPTQATGGISANTNQEIEADYDGTNACVYVAGVRGTDVPLTGNIVQLPSEIVGLSRRYNGDSWMQGTIDSLQIESTNFHTCASTSSFIPPTTKFLRDTNTVVLVNGNGPGTSGTNVWNNGVLPITWPSMDIPVITESDSFQSPPQIYHDFEVANGSYGIISQMQPASKFYNLTIDYNSYMGLELTDNTYNADVDNVFMDLGSGNSYGGYWEDNAAFSYQNRLKLSAGGYFPYFGLCNSTNMETDPASNTVDAVVCANADPLFTSPVMNGWEYDSENSYTGSALLMNNAGALTINGGTLVANSGVPVIQVAPTNSGTNLVLNGVQLDNSNTVPPIDLYGGPSQSTGFLTVATNGVTDAGIIGNPTPQQLCGSDARYCANTSVPIPNLPILGTPPSIAGTAHQTFTSTVGATSVTAADTTNNDYQVVFAHIYNPSTSAYPAITALPSGWSIYPGCPVAQNTNANNDLEYVLIHKNGASEPSTNSFTWAGQASNTFGDFYTIGISNTNGPDGNANCYTSNVSPVSVGATTQLLASTDLTVALGGTQATGTTFSGATSIDNWITSSTGWDGLGEAYYGSYPVTFTNSGAGGNNFASQISFSPSTANQGYPILSSTPPTRFGVLPQYYADSCYPALPNNGTGDDAAPLRNCMAAMPAGATMNLDGTKQYYFNSHANGTAFTSDNCEINLTSGQSLHLNGATITQSAAEVSVSDNYIICAGAPVFNTPGSSGGSPTFIPINDTALNASSVTTVTASDAGTFNSGDDIYIDWGNNTHNQDVCVGWNQVSDVNASTGVINLKYPMLKSYVHTNGGNTGCDGPFYSTTNTHARIYDWTTHPGCTAGTYNCTPLAHDVYIEGPGKIAQTQTGVNASNMIALQGVVRWGVDDLTLDSTSNNYFLYANYIQKGHANYDVLTGWGCNPDTALGGVFASNINDYNWDKVTLTGHPGVGCGSSSSEMAYGVNEGAELNHYSHDTATILAGLSTNGPNLGACVDMNGGWGDEVSYLTCNVQNGTGGATGMNGVIDTVNGPTFGPLAVVGPMKVWNSHITVQGATPAIQMQVPNDFAQGNTVYCGPSPNGCISFPYWAGSALDNTVHLEGCSSSGIGIGAGTGSFVQVIGNTIDSDSGACSWGIHTGTTGNQPIIGNNNIGLFSSGSFTNLLNINGSNSPNAKIFGNPGITDYPQLVSLACTSCPFDPTRSSISGNAGTICPIITKGGTAAISIDSVSIQNPLSITCSTTYPKVSVGDFSIAFGPFYSAAATMTGSNASYSSVAGGGVISGAAANDADFLAITTAGSGCTCTPGTSELGCMVYATACYRAQ